VGGVMLLSGGPGESATEVASALWPQMQETVGDRDLIAVDQRGTGYSIPSLACDDDSLEACRDRLRHERIDLATFNTEENAADIDAVRRALGYRQVDLLGGSYGTRLALAVMRDHPAGVRSAVLDSVAPPDIDVSIEQVRHLDDAVGRLFRACEIDSHCSTAFPHLRADFAAAVQRLSVTPVDLSEQTLDVSDLLAGDTSANPEPIDGVAFTDIVLMSLNDPITVRMVLLVISETAGGANSALELLLDDLAAIGGPASSFAVGMYQSVECASFARSDTVVSDATRRLPVELGAVGRTHLSSFVSDCRTWGVPARSPSTRQRVRSKIPTLLISGSLDPITPPAYAAHAGATLSRSRHITIAGAGHSVLVQSSCARRAARSFFRTPRPSIAIPCAHESTAMRFVVPDDLGSP
jgi:pimeloyl-ACP methyl ester carboxylesterase